jgi:nucleoside-diphosphate-sugar epimerase
LSCPVSRLPPEVEEALSARREKVRVLDASLEQYDRLDALHTEGIKLARVDETIRASLNEKARELRAQAEEVTRANLELAERFKAAFEVRVAEELGH